MEYLKGNLEFSWWSWRGCLRWYLWTLNILFYLFYSLLSFVFSRFLDFVDDFWQESKFETEIQVLKESHSYLLYGFASACQKTIKQRANLWFFSTYKQNSTEWATICFRTKWISVSIFVVPFVDWIVTSKLHQI